MRTNCRLTGDKSAHSERGLVCPLNSIRRLLRLLRACSVLVAHTRPDGTGFFYGTFSDETDNSHRVDVMPPRDIWSGDFNAEAAHPTDWVVYLDGEEVQRASSIEALSVLAVPRGE